MEIRLLGNTEIVVDGIAGTIPGTGERAVLALLALQTGRVVPADRLVDALWGERLPANPYNALQTRVSKLRRSLASLGGDGAAVVTVAPGYRLDVDPGQVDALHFTRSVAAARAAADEGAPADARRRYVEALGAWRGPALADFPEQAWATSEALRLEELRLAALGERIELDLQAGRHTDIVTELEALVVAHPLRERLYAQLMVALYRCGRQADALAAYQRARDTLDRELGLDPSPELRNLEAAILRQDAALAAPVRAPATQPRPGNVPARVASFVGRDDDVRDIIALLDRGRLVTITGPGGAGKTTLALEAARHVEDHVEDGVWFVDLSGATDDADVGVIVAATLGLPASDALSGESRELRLARQLQAHRCLLIIDNCEHVIDASAALIDRLLGGCPGVRVLATSREALAVPGEVQYALAPLPLPAAVELFAERARAASRSFALDAATEADVNDICAGLDGMPLAIELAAARVTSLSVEQIKARLSDRFRLLSGGSRTARARHQTLRATVDWSYELLSDDERVVLQRLSVFRAPWTVESAEQVCPDAVEEARGVYQHRVIDEGQMVDLLGRLVDRSLIVAGGGRFRMLETIRQYAADRLVESGEADTVMARNAARLLNLVEDCAPQLRGSGLQAAMHRLSEEHDDLRAALTWCADGGDVALGQRIAGALAWFWFLGDHEEGRRYLHALLNAGETDSRSRGRALQALSIVGRPGACVVHPEQACAAAARRSIELLQADGDRRGAAASKVLLAVEGITGDDEHRSLALLDEAVEDLADDDWGRALADFVRMEILVRWGDAAEGFETGDRAAAAFRKLGDPWGMSAVRAHRGHNMRVLGRLTEAAIAFDDALAIARPAGLQNTVYQVAGEAGILKAILGDEEGARRNLTEAVDVARRYGYRGGDAMADLGFGCLARRRDDLPVARRHFAAAVHGFTEVGSLLWLAIAYSGLGHAAALAGDAAAAEHAHRQVLGVAGTHSEPWVLATALEGLAGVALLRDDPGHAAELLGAAAAIRDEAQRPVDPLTRIDVERIASGARALLGDETFEVAYLRGRGDGAARRLAEVAG